MKEFDAYTDGLCAAKYDDSEEMRDKVFEEVVNWYKNMQQYSGEGIMQSDDAIIDAPNFLSHLADDIINFELEWKV